MSSHSVKVAVLAGGPALGSVAAALAEEPDERVVVVAHPRVLADVPPFVPTELAVADVVDRAFGCQCCRQRIDLVEVLRLVAVRRRPPDRVVIVIDDVDDITVVVYTLLSDPDLVRLCELDAVVAVADAIQLMTRLFAGLPLGDAATLERLGVADHVLLSGDGKVTDVGRDLLRSVLRAAAPFATVSTLDGVDTASIRAELVGLDAWWAPPRATGQRGLRATSAWMAIPDLALCEAKGVLDSAAVESWLDRLLSEHAPRLLRVQGVLAVDGTERLIGCRGIRSHLVTMPVGSAFDRSVPHQGSMSTVAVLGWDLPIAELSGSLQAAVAS